MANLYAYNSVWKQKTRNRGQLPLARRTFSDRDTSDETILLPFVFPAAVAAPGTFGPRRLLLGVGK